MLQVESNDSLMKQVAEKQSTTQQPASAQPSAELHCWTGKTNSGTPWEVHCGDVLETLKTFQENRFHCAITSPPYYWQRDYQVTGQIGLEPTINGYVNAIANSMDEVQRVLRKDGLLFLNLADTYYSAKGKPKGPDQKNKARRFGLRAVDTTGLGVPRKTIIGIPWRVAIEMIGRGWTLRAPIIWQRGSTLPEPTAKDRPWRTYEFIFMFSKSPRYHFDRTALDGLEDVWLISDRPNSSKGLHSAAFPNALVERCLAIGCPKEGEVLDPFAGTGTSLVAAVESRRPAVGIDLNGDFCKHMVNVLENKSSQNVLL